MYIKSECSSEDSAQGEVEAPVISGLSFYGRAGNLVLGASITAYIFRKQKIFTNRW
jgi:hypothetical protein